MVPSSYQCNWIPRLRNIAQRVCQKVQSSLGNASRLAPVSRGAGGDITLTIDNIAEHEIIQFCKSLPLPVTLLSEETGWMDIEPNLHKSTEISTSHIWVIADPIDGSRNAKRHIPFFNTSIAIGTGEHLSDIIAGIVLNINTGNEYFAEKNKGAFYNSQPMIPSKTPTLQDAVIGVNFTPDSFYRLNPLTKLCKSVKVIRQLGANAEEIALVGMGGLDIFVNVAHSLRSVDMAAAKIILEESDAIILNEHGQKHEDKLSLDRGLNIITAANFSLMNQLSEIFLLSTF